MSIRSILWRELKSRYEVTMAADAAHAFDAFATLTDVRVVLSDLDLGDGPDGLAILSEAAVRHPSSVRILISGSSRAPDLARQHPSVIHAWLPKPWPDGSIVATISALLEKRHQLARGSQGMERVERRPAVAVERRGFARHQIPLEVDVRFATWSLFRLTYAVDLSLGGLLFQLPDEPTLGQEISVTLHLPGGARPTVKARVSRVEPSIVQGQPFEVGAEFVSLTPEERIALEETLAADPKPTG